jgi:hypothetical protein
MYLWKSLRNAADFSIFQTQKLTPAEDVVFYVLLNTISLIVQVQGREQHGYGQERNRLREWNEQQLGEFQQRITEGYQDRWHYYSNLWSKDRRNTY